MQKAVLLSLLFVLLYNLFLFKAFLGIGFVLLVLLGLLFAFFTRNTQGKSTGIAHACAGVALLFASLQVYRANPAVDFFDTLLALYFTSAAWFFYKSEQAFSYHLFSFLLIPLANVFQPLGKLMTFTEEKERKNLAIKLPPSLTASIVRGFVIAIPAFLILLFLLVQADPIFEKRVVDALQQIGERTIISLIIFCTAFVSAIVTTKEFSLEKVKEIHSNPHRIYELVIIAGSVALLFGVFILMQLPYLFSNLSEQELHKIGIQSLTYSEYVRKGFFELLIASSIVLALLAYLLRYVHHMVRKEKQLVQGLGTVVIGETAVLLASAVKRDAMYQMEHGLTQARIVGALFLVMLAVFLVLFLLALYRRQQQRAIFLALVLPVLLFFLSTNLVPIEELVATKDPPTVNKEIDYSYLAGLSPDGYKGWLPTIQHAQKVLAQLQTVKKLSDEDYRLLNDVSFLYSLKNQVEYLRKKYGSNHMQELRPFATANMDHWQSFNMSEYEAYKYVVSHNEFTQIDKLLNEAQAIRDRDMQQTTQVGPTNTPVTPTQVQFSQ